MPAASSHAALLRKEGFSIDAISKTPKVKRFADNLVRSALPIRKPDSFGGHSPPLRVDKLSGRSVPDNLGF